jgi:hypothetical protein
MIILVLTACLVGHECASEDIAWFRSSGDQREFCEVAKAAYEAKYLPNLKPGDRADFRCKKLGEQ